MSGLGVIKEILPPIELSLDLPHLLHLPHPLAPVRLPDGPADEGEGSEVIPVFFGRNISEVFGLILAKCLRKQETELERTNNPDHILTTY